MKCKDFRDQLGSYVDESLDPASRRAVRAHLRECADCREWGLAIEPTLLFAVADPIEADRARIESCVDVVIARIRHDRLARRLRARRRPWLAAAAAAVIAATGGILWRTGVGPAETPIESTAGLQDEVRVPGPPPSVEVDVAGEDVRVYQFAAEEGDDIAVYYVVNPAMEL